MHTWGQSILPENKQIWLWRFLPKNQRDKTESVESNLDYSPGSGLLALPSQQQYVFLDLLTCSRGYYSVDSNLTSGTINGGRSKSRDRKVEVSKWHRFNIGAVPEPHMIELLELLAISIEGDAWIIERPPRIIEIANELAAVGIPKVIDMLNEGKAQSIWNLTDRLLERYFLD